jgi:hypothetical protein
MNGTSSSDYASPAGLAKLIRGELKTLYPGQKFSVRSRSYSGGSSVDVLWTDGPAWKEVQAATRKFQGCDFDGMTDSKSYVRNPYHSISWVQCQRRESEEAR